MRRPVSYLLFALVLTAALVAPAAAAEPGTETLTGTLEESTWGTPHATIKLKVGEASWKVILAPVSRMKTRGMSQEMIAKGAKVTVVGYPHREHKGELRAERITAGKSTFELR